jgi:hypothetical protein
MELCNVRKPARVAKWSMGAQGRTAAKMKDCWGLELVFVGQFEFSEWTRDNQLRYSAFLGLWEDKMCAPLRSASAVLQSLAGGCLRAH